MIRRDRTASDAGFTLTELLVSIGIFGILMAIVTTLFMRGLTTINTAKLGSSAQVQQENAIEWISRLVRYMDNPGSGSNPPAAMTEATRTAMTFTTFSGTGPVDRVPYKARLATTAQGVTSEVWTPALANGTVVLTNSLPTYPGSPATRVLVRKEGTHTPSMTFRYWANVNGVTTEVTPTGTASLTAQQIKDLTKIMVTITDSASAAGISQTILLANDR